MLTTEPALTRSRQTESCGESPAVCRIAGAEAGAGDAAATAQNCPKPMNCLKRRAARAAAHWKQVRDGNCIQFACGSTSQAEPDHGYHHSSGQNCASVQSNLLPRTQATQIGGGRDTDVTHIDDGFTSWWCCSEAGDPAAVLAYKRSHRAARKNWGIPPDFANPVRSQSLRQLRVTQGVSAANREWAGAEAC